MRIWDTEYSVNRASLVQGLNHATDEIVCLNSCPVVSNCMSFSRFLDSLRLGHCSHQAYKMDIKEYCTLVSRVKCKMHLK